MYQYLKRFLNEQVEINVVFPDDGILKATLLGVDSIGVAVFDHEKYPDVTQKYRFEKVDYFNQ